MNIKRQLAKEMKVIAGLNTLFCLNSHRCTTLLPHTWHHPQLRLRMPLLTTMSSPSPWESTQRHRSRDPIASPRGGPT